jgi:hypothetical protein
MERGQGRGVHALLAPDSPAPPHPNFLSPLQGSHILADRSRRLDMDGIMRGNCKRLWAEVLGSAEGEPAVEGGCDGAEASGVSGTCPHRPAKLAAFSLPKPALQGLP